MTITLALLTVTGSNTSQKSSVNNADDGSDPQNSCSGSSSGNTFGFHRGLGATTGPYVLDELDGKSTSHSRTEDAQGTVQPGASGTNVHLRRDHSGVGLTNAWFAEQGLLSLKTLWAKLAHLR